MAAIVAGNGLGLFDVFSGSPDGVAAHGRSAFGQAGNQCFVNAATGNLVLQALDERLSGRGLDLLHLRTHNSRGVPNDPDGDGWRWQGERSVSSQGNPGEAGSIVTRIGGDGHETRYAWNAERGAYVSAEGDGAHDSVAYETNAQVWRWTEGTTRRVETYSAATGKLTEEQDVSGHRTLYQHDAQGRLVRVIDSSSGQRLALTYAAIPGNPSLVRLQRVETQALEVDARGRATDRLARALKQVDYGYDDRGRLTSVKTDLSPSQTADNQVYATTYTYDGDSQRIASVVQSDGQGANFAYDASGRIASVVDADGARTLAYHVVSVDQEDGTTGLRTDVTLTGDGEPKTWRYLTDGKARLISIETPGPAPGDKLSTRYRYDADGNQIEAIDARGSIRTCEYDNRGNRVLDQDMLGNTVVRTYDERNRLLTETRYRNPDPDAGGPQPPSQPATAHFVYDAQARLRFKVSAEGRVEEHRYGTGGNAAGLLVQSLRYARSRYTADGIGGWTEAQLKAWAAAQDKTQLQLIDYAYDYRGNLARKTAFTQVDASGAGVTDAGTDIVEYIYDGHGDLLQVLAVRGEARDKYRAMASLVRDGLGRELQVIDGGGLRAIEYDDANRSLRVTTAAGLVETRSFDSWGRMIGVIRSGGSEDRAIQYVYDEVGRMRMAEDAQGARRFSFYDAAGRLRYRVDGTGAITGFEYDAVGHVAAETQYRNPADTSGWYDSATHAVVKRELAIGTDIVPDPAGDRVSRYVYDAANRLATSIDPENIGIGTTYDGMSQITQWRTGDRASRFFYDRDGRRVGMLDPLGYLTEYRYDAAGRLTETVRYAMRSPAAADVAAPVWMGGTHRAVVGGLPFEHFVPAYDEDGDTLAYSAVTALPAWLTLETGTGVALLKGTPPVGRADYSITLRAEDRRGKSADKTVYIAVLAAPTNPIAAADRADEQPVSSGFDATNAERPNPARVAPSADDVLAEWRPSDTEGLRSYLYYDGQGRAVGAVDERGFLSETIHDERVNTQRKIRYRDAVVVAAADTLATLRARAGAAVTLEIAEYDDHGRIGRRIGIDGAVTRYEYDAAGRLVREATAAGTDEERSRRMRYNAFGEITGLLGGVGAATLPENPSPAAIDAAIADFGVRHEYDSLGRQARTIDANGNATLFFYDSENRRTHTINAEREITEVKYNGYGQAESVRRYATRMAAADHGALTGGPASQLLGKMPAADPEKDASIGYEYDRRGLLVKQVDGEGFATTRNYTRQGEIAAETRVIAAGRTALTTYLYDHRGAVLAQRSDPGVIDAVRQTVYDAAGRIVKMVDGAGKTVDISYAKSGRSVETADALNRLVRMDHDSHGRVLAQTDAAGASTVYAYDDSVRSVRVTSPEGVQVATRKTAHGQVLDLEDGRGGITAYEYNEDGQLTRIIDALGKVVRSNVYDKSGRLLETVDALGRATRLGYDKADRIVERQHAQDGLKISYEFNALGQQVEVVEGAGSGVERVTRYRYDRKGQLLQAIVDPEGLQLSTRYAYDGLGNAVTIEQGTASEPSQHVVQHVYDGLGRRVKEIVAPSAVVGPGEPGTRDLATQYRYDPAGRLSRTIDPGGNSTWYVYDDAGQRTHVIDAEGGVTRYSYDANGRQVQVRRFAGRLVPGMLTLFGDVAPAMEPAMGDRDARTRFVYDGDGRIRFTLTARRGSQWTVQENRYDANGNAIESRHYDQHLDEATLDQIDGADSPGITVAEVALELTKLRYGEDDASLRKVRRTRFAYDANDRLRFTVDAHGAVVERAYDAAGNLLSRTSYARAAAPSAYTESGIDEAVDRSDPGNRIERFVYDVAGRQRFKLRVSAVDEHGTATRHVVSERVHDMHGRIVKEIDYANPVGTLSDYAAATVAAALAPSAADRCTAFVFDAAGRQSYRIRVLSPGAQGRHLVTRVEYDAMGKPTRSIAFAAQMGLADFSKSTLDAATAQVGDKDRVIAYVYDPAGRRRFVVAADRTFGETRYDAAGRVLETRRFDLRAAADTPLTEAGLGALRGTRAVGDGSTRGEKYAYDRVGRVVSVTDAKNSTETFAYDGLGNRIGKTDRNGAVWTYEYDRVGNVFREFSPPVEVVVDLNGDSENGPASRKVALEDRFHRDAFGNPIQTVERINSVDARTTNRTYDPLGRPVKTTLHGYYDPGTGKVEKDPGGSGSGRFQRGTEAIYNLFGETVRVGTRVGQAAFQYEYKTYDPLGRSIHDVDPMGCVTAFAYNAFGEQTWVTRHNVAIGGTTPANGSYWSADELVSLLGADASARTIATDYDNVGRKIEVRQPLADYYAGDATLRANAASVPTVSQQATIRFEYNAFGDLRCETIDLGGAQRRRQWRYYDAMGREILGVDGLSFHTSRGYDAFGNLIKTVEFAGPGAPGSGDENTLPQAAESAADRITGFVFDPLDRQISVQRFGMRYLHWDGDAYVEVGEARDVATVIRNITYDRNGNVIGRSDGNGATGFVYNELGQMVKIVEPMRLTAGRTSIDPFRDQVLVAPTITLTLNEFGNVIRQQRDPKSGRGEILTVLQDFDAAGNAIRIVQPQSGELYRQYDPMGRVVKEMRRIRATPSDWDAYEHVLERRYAYDANGRQTHVLDVYREDATTMQSGRASLFNPMGEVVEERRVWGPAAAAIDALDTAIVATYAYDRAGHMVEAITGQGAIKYYYNLDGKVTRQEQRELGADGDASPRILENGYDKLGRATVQRLPAFVASTAAYGERAVTPLIEQAYDRWGNVVLRATGDYVINDLSIRISTQRVTAAYEYNADNQLAVERQPVAPAWKADGSRYLAAARHMLRYDVAGRVVQELDLADNAGTPADEANILRIRSRQYDLGGQLLMQTDGTGIAVRFAYDAHGNRVGTRNAAGRTMVDAFDKNGNLMSRSVLRYPGGSQPPVLRMLRRYYHDQANRRYGEGDVMDDAGAVVHNTYVKLDERNLVRARRDGSGIVTAYAYDALGNKILERDANGNEQRWSYSLHPSDYSAGRLLSGTIAGDRTTTFVYDGYGQVGAETQPGQDNGRAYEYHGNGLLKSIAERATIGTRGMEGGADYLATTDVVRYAYEADGQLVKESFSRTGVQELGLHDNEGNVYEVYEDAIEPIERVIHIDYDQRGRMQAVRAPAAENPGRDALFLEYRYDELGNRRNIRADVVRGPSSFSSDKWYAYDAEGRMTIVDGALDGQQIKQGKGTTIAYDAVGRRRTVDRFVDIETYTSHTPETNETIYETWSEFYVEKYDYDDLDFLTAITRGTTRRDITHQVNNGPIEHLPDEPGVPNELVETRVYDVRGGLLNLSKHPYLGTDTVTTHMSSTYRGDGQLWSQNVEYPAFPDRKTRISNAYDTGGVLRGYVYHQGQGTSSEFTDSYEYEYAMEFGGYKEKRIAVESTRPGFGDGVTTNQYDAKGRLSRQSMVNPADYRSRTFLYGLDEQAVSKTEFAKTGDAPPRSGKQDYTYVQGRQVASLGTLSAAQFGNGFTPISDAYPPPSTSGHVVNEGDTLAGIAQLRFGDGALWYLIAEANSLGFGPDEALPSVEIGKSYRIPNLVGNVHNNADTFLPYSPADVIGDGTPWAGPLPPPSVDWVEGVLATAAITAVAVAVTVYTSGAATAALGTLLESSLASAIGAGIGAAAGNAAGQAVGIGLNQQNGFSGKQVLAAGVMGSAAAAAGGALNHPLARVTHGYITGQAVNRAIGLPQGSFTDSLVGLGTQLAVAGALGNTFSRIRTQHFAWGSAFEQLVGSALNPRSGWVRSRDWTLIVNQAVGAFTSVAVTGAAERLRQAVAESWASESRSRRRRELETRHHSSLVHAVFGGDGAGKPSTMEDWIRQGYELEMAGYDVVAGDVTVERFVNVDGDLKRVEYDRIYSESFPEDLRKALLEFGPMLAFEIEENRTEVEKSRLARHKDEKRWLGGNTNITPEPVFISRSLHKLGIPEHQASDATIKTLRWGYHKLYRPVKAAEYAMQMRSIDVSGARLNAEITFLSRALEISTGLGSVGWLRTAYGMVTSEVGSSIASEGAKAMGMGEGGQFWFGMMGGIAGGWIALPRSIPHSPIQTVPEGSPAGNLDNVVSGTITSSGGAGRTPSVPRFDEPSVYVQFEQRLFDTPDEAARDVLQRANPYSIATNTEMGGLIYQTSSGKYGYTGPIMGDYRSVTVQSAPIPPEAGRWVGDYHTHADYAVEINSIGTTKVKPFVARATVQEDPFADMFSDKTAESIGDLGMSRQRMQVLQDFTYKSYLATPGGHGMVFSPYQEIVSGSTAAAISGLPLNFQPITGLRYTF